MAQLSGADLRGALGFVAEVHAFEDEDSFRRGILPGLERLVPCDLAGYNELEPGGGALVVTHPQRMPDRIGTEVARLAHQHPLISVQMNGDGRAYKISDFLSARSFHALELYTEIYRQIDAEDQIAVGLPGDAVIGIAFNRSRRSFSERDREMLDLLRPHLAQAHTRLLERRRGAALLAALERGVAERAAAVAMLGRDNSLDYASETALSLLDSYFDGRRSGSLPAQLSAWLELPPGIGREIPPLVVEAHHGRLAVRAERSVGGGIVLIFDEEPALTAERLGSLGLTRRQAEVLALLAAGCSVGEIASEIFIAAGTVRKHLEHIYARLGVHSREEAVARARGACERR